MKVSIVMCSYNAAKYIQRALDSIVAQTYKDWELIISDDASTDDTIAIIETYLSDSRIILHKHPDNVGYVKNKNRAFTHVSGDLLTQLDADDTCPPVRIEKQVNVFLAHPEIKICGPNYQTIDVDDKVISYKEYGTDKIINKVSTDYPFWFPGLMFRKEIIDEFGLFSEYFSGIYGDDEYWTCRVNTKYPIYFIKDILYNYRISPFSLTSFYDNPRKLIAWDILLELHRQRNETGTDALAKGDIAAMKAFEQRTLNNKKLMAEKYRMWAAKAIDNKNWPQAKKLLTESLIRNPANLLSYRTLLYYLRNRIK